MREHGTRDARVDGLRRSFSQLSPGFCTRSRILVNRSLDLALDAVELRQGLLGCTNALSPQESEKEIQTHDAARR